MEQHRICLRHPIRQQGKRRLSSFRVWLKSGFGIAATVASVALLCKLDPACRVFFLPCADARKCDRSSNAIVLPDRGRRDTVVSAGAFMIPVIGCRTKCTGATDLVTADTEPFDVTFEVDIGGENQSGTGSFTVAVHPDWAPLAAARFAELAHAGWYDNSYVHRVIPNFVAQFGLPSTFRKVLEPIEDDTRKASNKRGTVVMANSGPNSRNTQIFINLKDNDKILDDTPLNFAPFGVVEDGMDIVDKLYKGYGESPNQKILSQRGNAYLEQKFPRLSKIRGLYKGYTRKKFTTANKLDDKAE